MHPKEPVKRKGERLKKNKIPEILDTEFDELTDQEISLRSPQEGDFQTLEPPSGPGPEPAAPELENYFRPDDLIQEEVVKLLARHPEIDADQIKVQVARGEVVLTGAVPEEKMKLLAVEVIKLIPGVKGVSNQLRLHNI